jgi:Lar family restriction alleviation protein
MGTSEGAVDEGIGRPEASRANAKLNPCPFCGSTNIQTDCFSVAFSVPTRSEDCFDYCKDCDAQGPAATDVAEAHDRWNARGRAPAPGSRKRADDVLYCSERPLDPYLAIVTDLLEKFTKQLAGCYPRVHLADSCQSGCQ